MKEAALKHVVSTVLKPTLKRILSENVINRDLASWEFPFVSVTVDETLAEYKVIVTPCNNRNVGYFLTPEEREDLIEKDEVYKLFLNELITRVSSWKELTHCFASREKESSLVSTVQFVLVEGELRTLRGDTFHLDTAFYTTLTLPVEDVFTDFVNQYRTDSSSASTVTWSVNIGGITDTYVGDTRVASNEPIIEDFSEQEVAYYERLLKDLKDATVDRQTLNGSDQLVINGLNELIKAIDLCDPASVD